MTGFARSAFPVAPAVNDLISAGRLGSGLLRTSPVGNRDISATAADAPVSRHI